MAAQVALYPRAKGNLDKRPIFAGALEGSYDSLIAKGKKKRNYTDCQNKIAVWINNGWDRGSPEMRCYACRGDGSHWRALVFFNGSFNFVGTGSGKNSHDYVAHSRCALISVTNARLGQFPR